MAAEAMRKPMTCELWKRDQLVATIAGTPESARPKKQ
jgi:hypothetical protein